MIKISYSTVSLKTFILREQPVLRKCSVEFGSFDLVALLCLFLCLCGQVHCLRAYYSRALNTYDVSRWPYSLWAIKKPCQKDIGLLSSRQFKYSTTCTFLSYPTHTCLMSVCTDRSLYQCSRNASTKDLQVLCYVYPTDIHWEPTPANAESNIRRTS